MTDKQLLKLVKGFRFGMIGRRSSRSWCFAICAPLQGFLRLHGVETTLCQTCFPQDEHMFLRLKDGRILDPTADQFDSGLPAVYLGPMPDVYERWMKEAEESS